MILPLIISLFTSSIPPPPLDFEINFESKRSFVESEKTMPGVHDDFRTPTSSDHKIPATTRCPPAPEKNRPQRSRLKRQISPATRRSLRFDLSVEFESIFLSMAANNFQEPQTKKARRDEI